MKFYSVYLLFITINLAASCTSNYEGDVLEKENEESEKELNTNIVWENWYLSVPINAGSGKATSISYKDIVNDLLTNTESKYFYENVNGSYTMWTKFTGYTTSGYSELGDKYCRTELREYWRGNQSTSDNWLMSTGVHIMETTLNVDYVQGNGRTIVAQIHGKESIGVPGNPATVKIRWNSGMIQIDYYTKPSNDDSWTSKYDEKLDFGRVDNEKFTFKIKVENGKLYCALFCEAKGLSKDYTEIYDYIGNGYIHENYFKTGNYFGWNDDYIKEAQVILHKVVTNHY